MFISYRNSCSIVSQFSITFELHVSWGSGLGGVLSALCLFQKVTNWNKPWDVIALQQVLYCKAPFLLKGHKHRTTKLFYLLFVQGFSSHARIFHSYRDVTITGQGHQIVNYTRHSQPLTNEGCLSFHTYCDIGHPFIMV